MVSEETPTPTPSDPTPVEPEPEDPNQPTTGNDELEDDIGFDDPEENKTGDNNGSTGGSQDGDDNDG